jgi:site-specific DNA-methyltransferase (adenine-specific)
MRQLWLTEPTEGDARLPGQIDSASSRAVPEAPLTDQQRQLVTLLPPADVLETLHSVGGGFQVAMLDPWYNKGIGGVREDYLEWLTHVIDLSAPLAQHVFVWGFPEIVAGLLDRLPRPLSLVAWLTWYYKNCPSVIRGWRSAQYTCLHLARPDASLYPEHFLNKAQLEKQGQGKLPLNIGFVGRGEQTGHPSQKPEKVLEPLYLMTTRPGDSILDPMCGAGTSGVVCARLGVRSVLCDASEEYTAIVQKRLGILRRPQSKRAGTHTRRARLSWGRSERSRKR